MEKEGRDYFFLSREEFFRLRRAKKILEWTRYLEYYYGTPKEGVDEALAAGKNILLCIDVKGAETIRARYPRENVTVFIMPPSLEVLRERIEKRCALSSDEVGRRLAQAEKEIRKSKKYHHVIVNDRLALAVRQLKDVLTQHICRRNE
jgi:guanylate kinase